MSRDFLAGFLSGTGIGLGLGMLLYYYLVARSLLHALMGMRRAGFTEVPPVENIPAEVHESLEL